MVEWLRALVLKFGGLRFKASTLSTSGICLDSVVLSSNARSRFVNGPLVCPLSVGILTMLHLFEIFVSFVSVACL